MLSADLVGRGRWMFPTSEGNRSTPTGTGNQSPGRESCRGSHAGDLGYEEGFTEEVALEREPGTLSGLWRKKSVVT